MNRQKPRSIADLSAHFGSYEALAKLLGISRCAVQMWKARGRIPPRRALEIERISKGKLKARDLVELR